MKKIIKGKVYVLGSDLDTNQIIPTEHLVYSLTLKRKKTTVSLLHQVSLKMPPVYLMGASYLQQKGNFNSNTLLS